MESLRRLGLNIRGSPYDDHCPPLLHQLMAIQRESDTEERFTVAPQVVEETHAPFRVAGVASLSIESLSRAGGGSAQRHNCVFPTSAAVTPSTNISALTPSPVYANQSTNANQSQMFDWPIKQSGASPVARRKENKDVHMTAGQSSDTRPPAKHLKETAEFNDGVGRVSFLRDVRRQQRPLIVPHGNYDHEESEASHGSALYHNTTRPGEHTLATHHTLEGTGITSAMLTSLSAVDATAGGVSIICKGERGIGAAGSHSTLVEEDVVMGLSADERPRRRVESVETAGASTLSRGGLSSNSQAQESRGAHSRAEQKGRGYEEGFDDEDDYPLLSPMDQSKVASPSAAYGSQGHVGIWERGAGIGSARSVSSIPPSPRYVSGGGRFVVTGGNDDELTRSNFRGYTPALPEDPKLYASYVESVEQRIKEEAPKAVAVEVQTLRLQTHRGSHVDPSRPTAALYSRDADEVRLREDFARELYRVKQQLEELRARHEHEQRLAQQHQHQPRPTQFMNHQPPLYGGAGGHRHKSPLRSSHAGGVEKTINVKIVRDYEEDVIPYPKPVKQPQQVTPRAPTPAYSSSFYTQSPSPKTRVSKKGPQSSIAYSSFDTTCRDSYLSESIRSFVSESVD